MLARYYGGAVGRFLSVDPQGGERRDPQRFNRHKYSANNPILYFDPDGKDEVKFGSRTFEIYPGDAFVVQGKNGGLHTVTYAGGGESGEFRVVDNSYERNARLPDPVKRYFLDNTGRDHKPHDLNSQVNGAPNPYSPAGGATAIGVVPAPEEARSTTEAVEKGASEIKTYYDDREVSPPMQCDDFTTELDKKLGTQLPVDASRGTEGYRDAVESDREKTTPGRR